MNSGFSHGVCEDEIMNKLGKTKNKDERGLASCLV